MEYSLGLGHIKLLTIILAFPPAETCLSMLGILPNRLLWIYEKNDINSSQYNNDKKRIYAYSWSYGQRGS